MKAELKETYRWCHFAKIRGFRLVPEEGDPVNETHIVLDDEQRVMLAYPGMFTLNLADVDGSITSELKRYATSFLTVTKNQDGKTFTSTLGPWAVIDEVEARRALLEAVAVL